MKAAIVKLVPLMILLSSCGTGVYLTSGSADDVYYNPADKQMVIEKRVTVADIPEPAVVQQQEEVIPDTVQVTEPDYALVDSTYEEFVDEEGNTVINYNYYYDNEDDFYYTDRINRFYRPYMGFSFYDPWYSYGGWGWNNYWYDPWYYDWYSPYYSYGWYNSWYNPWYSPWYGGYYGGWSNWYWNDYYWGGGWWGGNNSTDENYHYGHRRGWINDKAGGIRTGGTLKSDPVYATRGNPGTNSGTLDPGTKTSAAQQVVTRSSSDPKSASKASGIRSGVSSSQTGQTKTVTTPQNRTSSTSSYVRSRTGSSYVRTPAGTTQPAARSSQGQTGEKSSSYVRPRTSSQSTGIRSSSSGSTQRSSTGAVRSSSSGRSSSTYTGSSSGRSSGSTYSGSSSGRSSGSNYSSSGSSSGRSSGSSYSGSSSSSGRSSGSSSSGSSSSHSSGGGGSHSGSSSGRR